VILVGYSFGSALARLFFLVSLLKFPKYFEKVYCHCYGTPRLGNKWLELYLEKFSRQLKIINVENDIMINLPPKTLGYHNVKTTHLLNSVDVAYNTYGNHSLEYYKDCLKI
jgi:hypothetical protein